MCHSNLRSYGTYVTCTNFSACHSFSPPRRKHTASSSWFRGRGSWLNYWYDSELEGPPSAEGCCLSSINSSPESWSHRPFAIDCKSWEDAKWLCFGISSCPQVQSKHVPKLGKKSRVSRGAVVYDLRNCFFICVWAESVGQLSRHLLTVVGTLVEEVWPVTSTGKLQEVGVIGTFVPTLNLSGQQPSRTLRFLTLIPFHIIENNSWTELNDKEA